ncbi:MAG: NADH-quinone oxidoreductase subunit NuoG [Deltaproteobacteria bacterium]|nr:NADH-quinone oxidoreductase subunit NuoG [Deltaproteobacteria bacterium]
MVTVKINGKEITVEDNTLILDAARDAGYDIPTFCYQADLVGVGSCRMCLVEIEGQKKLQPSCVTPVLHGMSINTETQQVMSARSSMLEFLLANHAMDCPVCDKGGECELQDMVYKFGPHTGRHSEPKFKFHEKDYQLSPVIIKNSNRCVQCMKCVRVCREVVGANVLGALGRGDHQEPSSFFRHFLDCDQDGNCIEVCPVGCFMRLPYRYQARPWDLKGSDTICSYCGVGCRMVIEQRDGVVLRAKAQLGVGLNSETLCARGRFGFDFVNHPERLTTPLIRKSGRLEPATWEEAINTIVENVRSTNGAHIGGIASPRLTNEELYLFQKLIRGVLRSPNIDSTSRWEQNAVESYVAATGMNEGGVSVFDCLEADTVLVIGSHLSDENPVTDYIVRRISANRRMNLIIASPRAMKLDSSANTLLRHNPGTENAVLNSLALGVFAANADKLANNDSVKALKDSRIEDLLTLAGVKDSEINTIAQKLHASSTVSIIAGTEFLRFPEGTIGLAALKNILKSLGKKVLVMPTLDRANQRGAWEMGVHPNFGPGYSELREKGRGVDGMLLAAQNNQLDVLYVIGSDIASMYPEQELAVSALQKVKFLVVQDMFLTDTAKLAHVVLPGSSFGEKDGTFTNQEGRAQLIKKLLPTPGKAKKDIDIIRAIGEHFDRSFGPKNALLVLDEIRKEVPMYKDVNLLFNNRKNTENKLDNKASLVAAADSAALSIGEFKTKVERKTPDAPFQLVTGNHLFHSGKYSRMSRTLLGLVQGGEVEISEEDANSLGLKNGDRVKVRGRAYEATLTLRTKRGTKSGVAFIGENFDDAPIGKFFRRGDDIPRVGITKA